jgi:hypothetical protein
MRNFLKIVAAIGLLSLSSAAWGSTDPLSHVNPLPPLHEQKEQDVTSDLRSRGYEVERGYWTLWGTDQCKWAIKTIGNCYGNNPTAPYIVPLVPSWRDEFVDQKLHLAFGQVRRGFSTMYRLSDREALVVIALLPPPGAYFGLQSYVFTREGAINPDDPIYKALLDPALRNLIFDVSPNPSRMLTFSSIGNSNNNVVIKDKSGSAFDEERFFIVTPDAVTTRDVTAALMRAGVPDPNHIFVEPVSTGVVRLGLGPAADDLITVFRYALPSDEGKVWQQRLPLAVLRVRDTNAARATEPYPVPILDTRTANSELALKGDLDDLVSAVKQRWQQPEAPVGPFLVPVLPPPKGINLIGQLCLRHPMNCLGDTQDTDSYRISPTLSIDGGEVIAVVGTLAKATGNATYVSLAVNRFEVLEGVANVTDGVLLGTAKDFENDVSNTDKFYVYYVARDCSGLENCLPLTKSEVPAGETIKLMQRNYIRPGTARGPDAKDLLSPYVIIFNGTTRP